MNKLIFITLIRCQIVGAMKTIKNLIPNLHLHVPTIQFNSIQIELLVILAGAALVAMAIATMMVMVVSKF